MTKDTKYNLIFITILLILILPGGIRLFTKMMDPARTRSLAQPDPRFRTAAYVDPNDFPDSIERIVPTQTAAWVRSLVSPNGVVTEGPPINSNNVLLSTHRAFEIIRIVPSPENTAMMILVWREDPADKASNFHVTLAHGATTSQGRLLSDHVLDVPKIVRSELNSVGYITPPKTIHVLELEFPPDATAKGVAEITVESTGGNIWSDAALIGRK